MRIVYFVAAQSAVVYMNETVEGTMNKCIVIVSLFFFLQFVGCYTEDGAKKAKINGLNGFCL